MRMRAFIIPALGLAAVIMGFLVFNLINDNLVYYRTPTEVLADDITDGERLRIGGQVMVGTVVQQVDSVEFEVGDGINNIAVVHQGAAAQLFQEGIGVVVEGRWQDGTFHSDTMLVKHDEQYRTEDGSVYQKPTGGSADS